MYMESQRIYNGQNILEKENYKIQSKENYKVQSQKTNSTSIYKEFQESAMQKE